MSIIIGIDHGYYAIKTAHCSFPAGLTSYGEHEPYTRQGLLEFGGCFFVCGSGRQPIQRDKTVNDNYYLLTLAAIAKEIHLTMLIRIFIRSNIISGAIFKILFRSFYAEILALQGFPAGLRDSYFIRDKSGYPEFRDNQTFSIAGSRKGFGDPRGTLFFELARLAEARKPPYLLFENVPYALLHIRYIMSCKQLCKVSFRK